jgi:hypothetical protein
MQVVPFAAGLYSGMKGPFEVVQFDDMPDENIVYVEGQGDTFISDDPDESKNYLKAFRRLTEKSLTPPDSVGLLLKASSEMA